MKNLNEVIALETQNWEDIYNFLKLPPRKISHSRNTNETKIEVAINLDGKGKADIKTGLGFFDHMLEQVAKHSGMDLTIIIATAIFILMNIIRLKMLHWLWEKLLCLALGDKRGIERYGFLLPMDDCLAQVAIDFGGRSWLVWDAEFKREKIGEMPTEMFYHFFKSFQRCCKMQSEYKSRRN